MTKLAPLITGFLRDYMPRQRGYSPESCETYAFSFKLLFDFAAKRLGTRPSRLTIEDLDAPLIVAFLAHIEQERGNGAATRNLRLAAIKTFMRYVEHRVPSALEQIGRVHAIPVKRHDQKLIRHLTMDEVRAILNAPDLATRSGVRDRAMMHLCFAGGLRVSELVGVLTENLSLQHGASVTIRGKGRKERKERKERCLPLWKDTARDLRAWLSVRGAVRVPELFVNAQDEPMTRAGFVARESGWCGDAVIGLGDACKPMLSREAAWARVHTGLLLADHAPQYARCARRPLPAMAVRDLLPLPPSGGIPREATRSLSPPSSADAAGQGCGTVVAALKDRHQGRDGRGLGNSNRRSPWLRLAPSPAQKMARTPAPSRRSCSTSRYASFRPNPPTTRRRRTCA
jgi:site-specific recombinase XerD